MKRLAWNTIALLFAASFVAQAAEWRMDPAASRLNFAASYQGQAAPGTFKQFDTRLRFDPARPKEGRLDVTVKLTSIDMGSSEINEAIRDPDWFDLKRFPEAQFSSTGIEPDGPGRYVARGTLRLKGAEQPVAVPFTWNVADKTATMAGGLTLKRGAFGVGVGDWASGEIIGLDVKVSFNVRLQRAD